MTKINKLVISGFKSFARKTEIIFGPNYNCVLGPNGSGKSNVLDSLCFVLGKAGAKGLRAEKSSNLIYNGGKTKNPAKEGMVSIYFDNSSKLFPVEEKEVKITRIIKHSGQGVYKINNKVRTRQQILEMMSYAKINPDGYNIILQGDIVRLVEMSPVQRRQLIEEIAGISIYEEKKQKSLSELGRIDERLREADIILRERSTHLKELKKERDQALKYRDLTDKIRTNKASYLNLQIEKKKKDLESFGQSTSKSEEQFKELSQEIKDIKNSIQENKDEMKRISDEIESKGEKDQVEIHKQVEQLKINVATDQARVESLHTEIGRIGTRKSQLEKSMDDINKQVERIKKEIKAFEQEKSRKIEQQKFIDKKITEFRKKHAMDDAVEVDNDIEKIDNDCEALEKSIQSIREKYQEMLRQKDKIEIQLDSLDEKIDKVKEVEKEHKKEIDSLRDKRQEFKKATLELNRVLNEDSSIASQLGTARGKLIVVNEELSKEKAKNVGIQESLLSDQAVREILKQKGTIPGIHGMVSGLGSVKGKYSLALEIAAGPRLKSIVVESDTVAARCIKFIKDRRLGIATFLPLNKINPPQRNLDKSNEKANGVHGYAINLVSFQTKFKNIFQYVFSDTLVVENIDVARRIGVGTCRMITLDGDLVEKSGAMQGGYRQRKRTGMGFSEKEVTEHIDELEKQASDLKNTIARLEQQKADNEAIIENLRENKANLEGEIIKTEKSLHLDNEDMEVSKKIKTDLTQQLSEATKEVDELQKQISDKNRELAQHKIKRSTLKNKVAEMRSPTVLAELNTFEQKKTEIRESLIRIESELKNLQGQSKSVYESEKGNVILILKQLEKEKASFEKELQSLKDKISKDKIELKEKEVLEKEFYKKFKALFDQRNKLSETNNKLDMTLDKTEEKQREVERKMNTISLEKARIKAEMAGLLEDFSQYEGVKIIKKDRESLKREILEFEVLLRQIGAVNEKALEIYESVEIEYKQLMSKKEILANERSDILLMINKIEAKKTELFMKTLDEVTDNFMTTFQDLSTKGDAHLVLENPDSPFEGGLLIKVKLIGKKFLDIRSLSGGEKTLTALAFLFAVQEYEPAFFYVLDEVDAALDKRNSEKLAKKIAKYSAKAQYIIISHNDGVISEASNLYGVSMDEHNISKVVSLKI
ncbi:chromosome segregation protein SMC [Candidatus Woesearchaeota archaeon]|nr:chromosome segregation protein SMC [Candidatus Woesearchaeota archaeon]